MWMVQEDWHGVVGYFRRRKNAVVACKTILNNWDKEYENDPEFEDTYDTFGIWDVATATKISINDKNIFQKTIDKLTKWWYNKVKK